MPGHLTLDARLEGVDEPGLKRLAREVSARSGAPHVSRSYRFPYAVVAWHDAPVGVDLERVEPCDAAFAASICTPGERPAMLACADGLDRRAASLWSSKEALSKALGDALRYDPRRLTGPGAWPEGRSGPWRAKRLHAPGGHVAWLCWREVK